MKVIVKYIGRKLSGSHVSFPVGCKNKSGISHVVAINPYLEMERVDAEKLVTLDRAHPSKEHTDWNYAIVDDNEVLLEEHREVMRLRENATPSPVYTVSASDVVVLKKKPGRKPKVNGPVKPVNDAPTPLQNEG